MVHVRRARTLSLKNVPLRWKKIWFLLVWFASSSEGKTVRGHHQTLLMRSIIHRVVRYGVIFAAIFQYAKKMCFAWYAAKLQIVQAGTVSNSPAIIFKIIFKGDRQFSAVCIWGSSIILVFAKESHQFNAISRDLWMHDHGVRDRWRVDQVGH